MDESPLNWSAVIDVLNDMHARGIIAKYAVGGAMAGILHDEAISTVDLDIFFFFTKPQSRLVLSLEEIYDYSREKGFVFDHEFIHIHGWLVQFVEASLDPLWKEAVEQAETIVIDERNVPVMLPEHLAAMWLLAGRTKDKAKIEAFDESGVIDRKKLADVLERFDMIEKWRAMQSTLSTKYQF